MVCVTIKQSGRSLDSGFHERCLGAAWRGWRAQRGNTYSGGVEDDDDDQPGEQDREDTVDQGVGNDRPHVGEVLSWGEDTAGSERAGELVGLGKEAQLGVAGEDLLPASGERDRSVPD